MLALCVAADDVYFTTDLYRWTNEVRLSNKRKKVKPVARPVFQGLQKLLLEESHGAKCEAHCILHFATIKWIMREQ